MLGQEVATCILCGQGPICNLSSSNISDCTEHPMSFRNMELTSGVFEFVVISNVTMTLFTFLRIEYSGFKIRQQELAPEQNQDDNAVSRTWKFVWLKMKSLFCFAKVNHDQGNCDCKLFRNGNSILT